MAHPQFYRAARIHPRHQPTPPSPPSPPSPQSPVLVRALRRNKNTSQRRLQSTASKSFIAGDETYQTYLKSCGLLEYSLFLNVDKRSHLLVYGVPPDAAVAAGCQFDEAHVVIVNRQGKPVAVLMWSNVEEGYSMFKEVESPPVGIFKLRA